jgi:hypothetical protein
MPSTTVANATAHSHTTTTTTTDQPQTPRRRSVFLRVYWMLLGAAALFTLGLIVLRGGHSVTSVPSLGMWVVAASMIAARWLDITRFDGLTAEGEAATPSHLRSYALGVAVITAGLWAGALAVG